jgi:hypothetical protein
METNNLTRKNVYPIRLNDSEMNMLKELRKTLKISDLFRSFIYHYYYAKRNENCADIADMMKLNRYE